MRIYTVQAALQCILQAALKVKILSAQYLFDILRRTEFTVSKWCTKITLKEDPVCIFICIYIWLEKQGSSLSFQMLGTEFCAASPTPHLGNSGWILSGDISWKSNTNKKEENEEQTFYLQFQKAIFTLIWSRADRAARSRHFWHSSFRKHLKQWDESMKPLWPLRGLSTWIGSYRKTLFPCLGHKCTVWQ